jgi:hypothetical protein
MAAAELRDSAPDLDGEKWREAYDTICSTYRSALLNTLYCGKRQARMSAYNLILEISIVVMAAIVTALTVKESAIAPWLMISTAGAATVLSGLKPVLRLGDATARYAVQHGGYRELYLAYQDLVSVVRVEGRVTAAAWREHEALSRRFRALEATSDPNPSVKYRQALQREVEMQIPVEDLRIA